VTRRLNKIQAGVDAVVNDFLTVDLVFVVQILVKSGLNVLNNWSPTRDVSEGKRRGEANRLPLIIVHEITETRGINNGQTEANTILLNVCYVEISDHALRRVTRIENEPALMLSMATVLGLSALGGRGSLGW